MKTQKSQFDKNKNRIWEQLGLDGNQRMTAAAAAATDRPVPTRCSAFMFEAKIETDSVLEPER